LEKDQAEDDVLVLGGVHVAAQLVGRRPQLVLEAEACAVCRLAGGLIRRLPGSRHCPFPLLVGVWPALSQGPRNLSPIGCTGPINTGGAVGSCGSRHTRKFYEFVKYT